MDQTPSFIYLYSLPLQI